MKELHFDCIILAGDGDAHLKANMHKSLLKVCGKESCAWAAEAAKAAGAEKIHIAADNVYEDMIGIFKNKNVLVGKNAAEIVELYKGIDKTVMILNGDTPLISPETIRSAVEYHLPENDMTILTCIRGGKDEMFSGMYAVNAADLANAAEEIIDECTCSEKWLRRCVNYIAENSTGVPDSCTTEDFNDIRAAEDLVSLAECEKIMRKRINEEHMLNGVLMRDPDAVYIDADVKIGEGTYIGPGVMITKGSSVGKGCTLDGVCRISNSHIADDTDIVSSVIIDSEIGSSTHVGPFAYIRPNCVVGNNIKVGDFVELKNSNIGNGTKISHLTYLGDSDIGENVNFGCGTVTCNYDGSKKFRTTIGNHCFVGCNTNFVAPVNIGNGAYIAAGSTITDDIPEDALSIARARQVNKEGWKDKRNKD